MGIAVGEGDSFLERKIIRIGRAEIDFWYNLESANTFPPILMIHGMFGGGWYFENWARFLCDKCFAVYIINDLHEGEDLRKVDFFTYLEKSTKVAEEICATRKNKIILIGHSMGGLIAQKIAETKPHLVAGLVLVASAPPKGISSMSWSVAKAMAKHLFPLAFNLPLKIDRGSTFKLILSWLGDEKRKEQIFQKFVPESSRVAKQLAFSRIPIDEKKVSCKILVVAGVYDKLLPLKVQAKIVEKYDSEYLSFLTGHMPMLERASEEAIKSIHRRIVTYIK
mgnify:CR=1 FL=1